MLRVYGSGVFIVRLQSLGMQVACFKALEKVYGAQRANLDLDAL